MCVPTSSEITLGFAGVLAATGHMNLFAAIGVGVTGEVLGAYLAWIIGRTGGRALVDRFGKYLLITHADLDRTEEWYRRHERWGVFGGRLVPVIRNFAALPAGVAEVPLVSFGVLTFFGSLIWDSAMAAIGYGVGSRWSEIMHGFSDAGYLAALIVAAAAAVFFWHRIRSYRAHRDLSAPTRDRSGSYGAGPTSSSTSTDPFPPGSRAGGSTFGGGQSEPPSGSTYLARTGSSSLLEPQGQTGSKRPGRTHVTILPPDHAVGTEPGSS
jgi:membrane protein DedA with SNARE-associated domain